MEAITKTEKVRQLVLAEEWAEAFKIASKFPRLGKYKDVITRAASARLNPRFYQQIGKDLNEIEASGKAGLVMMFVNKERNTKR